MARRRWYGNLNVSPYNATTMSNEAQITKGSKMLASQGNEILTPLNKVATDNNLPIATADSPIPDSFNYNTLNEKITAWSAEDIAGSTSSCGAACTGLCTSTCASSCTGGCGTSCGDNCGSGCSKQCTNGCSGSCGSGCSGSCSGSCGGSCGSG